MKPGNLLPGGLRSTPPQDALLKTDSQEKANKAEEEHKSYHAAHAELQSVQRPSADRGRHGGVQEFEPTIAKVETPPAPAIVPEPSPAVYAA